MSNIDKYVKWILIIGGSVYLLGFFNVFLYEKDQSLIKVYNFNVNKNLYLLFEFVFSISCISLGLRIKKQ